MRCHPTESFGIWHSVNNKRGEGDFFQCPYTKRWAPKLAMLRPRGGRRKPTSGTLFLFVVCCVSLVHAAFFLWTRVATHRRLPQPNVPVPAPGKHANDSRRHSSSSSSNTNQKRLLIAVPLTDFDLPAIQDNLLRRWKEVGPACSGGGGDGSNGKTAHRYNNLRTFDRDRENDRPVLWFYYAKGKKEQQLSGALFDKALQTIRHTTILSRCFAQVHIVRANLPTKIQDDYPAGVNLMFYNLLLGQVAVANDSESGRSGSDNNPTTTTTSLTAAFHSVFWMEPDVFPIKPYWIDRLVRESALDDQFWVKGSMYMGDMFDSAPEGSKDWQWIGHINGNALYRLNSPEFAQFLRIVMDLEPPDAVWKPFDVSIWKVLHDFPYFWHVYQRVAKHFVYADLIDHWAFTLTDSDIQHSKSNPRTYLVHGKSTSAGITRYRDKVEKIRGGLEGDQRRADASWQKHISVFIRAQARDVDYVVLAATSVSKNLPWALEIVVAVPWADVQMFTAHLEGFTAKTVASRFGTRTTTILKIVREEPLSAANAPPPSSPWMQEAYTRAMADTYCSASSTFILQIQADCVLMRSVSRKDLFFGGKPIVRYDHYANVPTAAALWQAGTEAALGQEHRSDVYVASSCSTPELYPKEVYIRMRSWIEQTHARSFRSFLATQRTLKTCLEGKVDHSAFCRRPLSVDHHKRGFSLPAVLGAFMWAHMHEQSAWLPHNQAEYRRTTFAPILPGLGCQGNSWLGRKIAKTADDLKALKGAMTSGDCEAAMALRQPWLRSIIRRVD